MRSLLSPSLFLLSFLLSLFFSLSFSFFLFLSLLYRYPSYLISSERVLVIGMNFLRGIKGIFGVTLPHLKDALGKLFDRSCYNFVAGSIGIPKGVSAI